MCAYTAAADQNPGKSMSMSKRPLRVVCVLAAVVMLSACAGGRHQARAEARQEAVIAKGKDAKGYRFDMTQRGRQMSADDFEAWMKANGLRIAKGPGPKDAKAKAASAKRKRD